MSKHKVTRQSIAVGKGKPRMWFVACTCGWRVAAPTKFPDLYEREHEEEVKFSSAAHEMVRIPRDYRGER